MLSVQTSWIEALTVMGVEEPYPELNVVDAKHTMLMGGGLAASAVRYDSGREALFISEDLGGKKLREILEHEAAHFAAWRLHGEGIPAHGAKWREHCLARASDPKACKPTDFGRIN